MEEKNICINKGVVIGFGVGMMWICVILLIFESIHLHIVFDIPLHVFIPLLVVPGIIASFMTLRVKKMVGDG